MQRANAELAVLAVATAFSALLLVAARRRRRKPGESPSLATPPPPPDLSIIARQGTADELLSICRLRYMVYVGELKRSNYSYVDNIREILEDPLDHADDLFVPSVGCVRVHVPLPNKYAPLFSTTDASVWGEFAKTPHAFAFFSRFMVHSKFRGKSYGYTDLLYAAAAVEARRMGARFLLLNCTPALAVMYEARGWVRYKPAVWDEGMGLQVKHLLHALPCTHSYRP